MENRDLGTIRYVHGSQDSTDVDVIYVFDCLPTIAECKSFCDGHRGENGNIIVVEKGIVAFAYKGSVDEVNNGLFSTYALHEQEYPLVIERLVPRDILLKDIKVIRKLLSSLSRTNYRKDIKKALRSNWDEKLRALNKIDYNALDYSAVPKSNKNDLLKSFAFQIGQAIALHEGVELYTKEEVARYFPELEAYLQRKETSNENIAQCIRRFIKLMEGLPAEIIGEEIVRFGEPFNAQYHVNQEKRIG